MKKFFIASIVCIITQSIIGSAPHGRAHHYRSNQLLGQPHLSTGAKNRQTFQQLHNETQEAINEALFEARGHVREAATHAARTALVKPLYETVRDGLLSLGTSASNKVTETITPKKPKKTDEVNTFTLDGFELPAPKKVKSK